MDKKLKAKWIKALRSGRYKPTQGDLHADGRFCCLGVLCMVAGAKRADISGFGYPREIEGFEGLIPDEVAKALAHMNDMQAGENKTPETEYGTDEQPPFELIAGFIEETL
jgi:hypothetical protein